MARLGRHFLTFLLMGVACYVGLVLFAQGDNFLFALSTFPLSYVPFLLTLACLNFFLRYWRWQIYLNALGIHLQFRRSFSIFMAGLTITITPGKAGEAIKAHLLRKERGNPWSMGLPVVFAERLTDLVGVIILVTLSLRGLPLESGPVLFGAAVCLLILLILIHSTLFRSVVGYLGKIPGMAGPSEWLLEMHKNVKHLLDPRFFLSGVLISMVAWFAECMVLHLSLIACQSEASCLQAIFIYALSTLAGVLSILPGGLVAAEGSMIGLLLLFGLDRNMSFLVTHIVRLCTLWFAVFVGMIFLFYMQRELRLKRQEL